MGLYQADGYLHVHVITLMMLLSIYFHGDISRYQADDTIYLHVMTFWL